MNFGGQVKREGTMVEARKIAAILAADIVGFSRLTSADEDRTLARLRALRSDLIDPTRRRRKINSPSKQSAMRVIARYGTGKRVEHALQDGAISGADARDRAGVFPLSRFDPSVGSDDNLLWDQWAKHAENAAVAAGLPKGLAAGLMGALGECQGERRQCPP